MVTLGRFLQSCMFRVQSKPSLRCPGGGEGWCVVRPPGGLLAMRRAMERRRRLQRMGMGGWGVSSALGLGSSGAGGVWAALRTLVSQWIPCALWDVVHKKWMAGSAWHPVPGSGGGLKPIERIAFALPRTFLSLSKSNNLHCLKKQF